MAGSHCRLDLPHSDTPKLCPAQGSAEALGMLTGAWMLRGCLQSLTQHHITNMHAGQQPGAGQMGKARQGSYLSIWQLRREGIPTMEATVSRELRVPTGQAGHCALRSV